MEDRPSETQGSSQLGQRISVPGISRKVEGLVVLYPAAFTSVDRVVTVLHQPRIQQSGASSHTKDLILSQSFMKQAKTDDIIQSVQQKVKERRHLEAKKLKKRIVR